MRRGVKVVLYAAATVFFALSAAFFGAGVPRMWAMRSRVNVLTPSGAGLEYNEWVVNLAIGIAVAVISLVLAILLGWLTRRNWRAWKAEVDPMRCKTCGYSLRGLVEPRCPECNTPFDPALLGKRESR
jgi:hypothetical protein